ncbi:MAG: hypothetical protein J6U17_02440 [Kiritimatiellae bacterium]|nr:hypothetical protein [Kiritimatiellia bacterium]
MQVVDGESFLGVATGERETVRPSGEARAEMGRLLRERRAQMPVVESTGRPLPYPDDPGLAAGAAA